MGQDRPIATCMVAIFSEQNSTYVFETLAPVDKDGNIIAGKYNGQNIHNFNVILSNKSESCLEDIKDDEELKVFVESSVRVNKAYYKVNVARLFANYAEGKLYSNFVTLDQVEKIAAKYLACPDDLRERNNIYRLMYFAMVRKIAMDLKDVAIFDGVAMKLENGEVDDVMIYDITLPSYYRSSSFNKSINQIMKLIDETVEKLHPIVSKPVSSSTSNPSEAGESKTLVSTTVATLSITQPNLLVRNILDSLYKKFVGQEEAAKYLLLNIYFNINRVSKLPNDVAARNKSTILLDGPTGTGKTAILKEIAKHLNVPVVITGATEYSTVGYKGGDLENVLIELLRSAKGDVVLAQKGVVFFDEFDKLASSNDSRESIFKKGVQEELLRYVEGGVFSVYYGGKTISFDTSKVTFICGGAFTDLREEKTKESFGRKTIGFTSEAENKEKTYELTDEDFIKFGIKRELIGRLKTKIHTRAYSKEDLEKILRDSSISPLAEFVDILGSDEEYQPIIYTSEEFIQKVSEMAYDLNTGARALQEIIESVRTMLLEDLILNRPNQINLGASILDEVKKQTVREASI